MTRAQLPHKGWRPREYQQAAWEASRKLNKVGGIRELLLAWHRRAGKDELGLHAVAIAAMERVGDYWHMLPQANQARRAIWEGVNPRTGQARWKDAFPDTIISHVDNQAMKLTFVNGATWSVLGSDNADALVGAVPVGIVYSEAALTVPSTIALMRPILAENDGWAAYISSVRGQNHFYDLFRSLRKRPDRAFVQKLSAYDTPVFTEAQLEDELQAYIDQYGHAIGTAYFRQEYLSDWEGAVIGSVFSAEIEKLKVRSGIGYFPYNPSYPVITSWDLGQSDLTVVLFWQVINNVPRIISIFASSDMDVAEYATMLHDKGYYYSDHFLPHDGGFKGRASPLTFADELARFGIKATPVERPTRKREGIAQVARTLKACAIHAPEWEAYTNEDSDSTVDIKDPNDCTILVNALSSHRFKYDKERKVLSEQPIHDWTSHYVDAVQTFAIGMLSKPYSSSRILLGHPHDDPAMYADIRLRDIIRPRQPRRKGFA